MSNYSFTILAAIVAITYLGTSFFLANVRIPNRVQYLYYRYLATIQQIIRDLVIVVNGKIYYYAILGFVFIFINYLNLAGLIPYTFAVTSQFSETFLLAFLFFVTINLTGLYYHGVDMLNLFHPQGTPLVIIPLLVIIEFISYFARIFSLGIRLFANITAGHILLKILAWFTFLLIEITAISLIGMVIITTLWGLEFFISILQAYVFLILLCIYLAEVLVFH